MFAESIKTNLPTELLRTLVTVCEFRSVTKAAQLLQLTQPAVLQQIKKLEIIIGSEIIDRQLAGVNLTETGSEILRSAQQLLSINDKIIFESGDQAGLQIVRLGIPNLFAKSVLPKIVEEIRAWAPKAQLQVCCDNSPNVLRMLHMGYLDIAFAYGEANDMAAAKGSWVEEIGWVRASSFTASPDAPVPLISSPNVLRVDQIATDALKRSKRRYQIVFSAVDFGARFAAVAAGLGYLPLTRRLVPPNLVIEEDTLPPLGEFMVGIFVRKDFPRCGLGGRRQSRTERHPSGAGLSAWCRLGSSSRQGGRALP
jgi:DNA-binding transcriptional LysR family regulator